MLSLLLLVGPLLASAQVRAPGWTARVLVVDEGGTPAKASVSRVQQAADGAWRWIASGRAEGPGLYAFEVEGQHDAITVRAIDWERGAGWCRLERGGSDPARIELGGAGCLEGVLVDPLGEPISGFEVVGRGESLLAAHLAPRDGQDIPTLQDHAPRVGLIEARARTDAQGRFRLAGLTDERFFLGFDRPPSTQRGVQLEPTLHRADGRPLRIVAPLHRLELAPLDEAGTPVADARAFVVQLEPYPRSSWDFGPLFETRADPGRFALRAGATYAFGLWSPTRGLVEATLVAGADGRYLQRPQPRLPAPQPTGTLVLRSDGPRSPIGRVGRVLAPRSRHVLVEERFARELRFELPPGRYVARVAERTWAGMCPGRWERYGLTEAERGVVVESGRETVADLALAQGVRLVLTVEAPGADRACVRRVGSDGTPGPLLMFEPDDPEVILAAEGYSSIAVGVPFATRYPLAPGRHVLRVEADGFATRTLELDVVEGPDLDVRLALERRDAEPPGG